MLVNTKVENTLGWNKGGKTWKFIGMLRYIISCMGEWLSVIKYLSYGLEESYFAYDNIIFEKWTSILISSMNKGLPLTNL
jgi:hypothetical protein